MYALIQILIFYFLQPIDKITFIALSLSFVFLGMAMNIHNNILDKSIDREKPGFRDFNTGVYYRIYIFFMILFALSLKEAHISLLYLLISFSAALLLWLYNKYLKKTPFYGNFIVAIIISTAIVFPGWAAGMENENHYLILFFLGMYAFTLNLIREIVKDLEDLNLDKKAGYRTLAVLDPQIAHRFVYLLTFLLIASLFFVSSYISLVHFLALVIISILFSALFLFYLKNNKYKLSTRIIKLLMLLGFLLVLTGII